ncbi:PAS domain S-box protein [Halobellus sp. Atlit-31R]|nr:PAS domain S-box protein [Halobellus sp. Atlit-31R]
MTQPHPYGHLIEHVQDAIVEFALVDGKPIVRDVNAAFVDIFGFQAGDIEDEPLNEWIVPEWLAAEADRFDRQTATGEINYQRVKRETATGLREFLYRGIPYGPEHGDADVDGFAVYTDITELNRQRYRLEVLNRILRHNLRNEANLIVGHTTRLLAQLPEQDDDAVAAAATVEQAAAKLERLAHEAGEIESLLSAGRLVDEVDCVPLAYAVVREHRQQSPRARIEVDLPDRMVVRGDRHLQSAIHSLVDNAVEHNPSAEPFVRVSVTALEPGWAAVRVDDDGPAIPRAERDVITGDLEATQTHHGSGLGLWLVKWAAERYGGELSFGETADGNRVTIRLPTP